MQRIKCCYTVVKAITPYMPNSVHLADRKTFYSARTYASYRRSVFISQSNDIFTNLALEDWLYRHVDFSEHQVLLLWQNKPCVVIGRHQNPWMEANLSLLAKKGIIFARRNSGGGTVYHDLGNLNCTFFTTRADYHRKRNLELICEAVKAKWDIPIEINAREDIMLDNKYKISGTASKLGGKNAYHHCTVLVDVNTSNLSQVLKPEELGMESKATASVRSTISNLSSLGLHITLPEIQSTIGSLYLCPSEANKTVPLGYHMINPSEGWFPGLEKLRDEFARWEWRFGKTPRFTVTRQCGHDVTVQIAVYHGVIESIRSFGEDSCKATDWPFLNGAKLYSSILNQVNEEFAHCDSNFRSALFNILNSLVRGLDQLGNSS